MKEITLGDWLKDINESLQLLCEHANGSYTARWIGGFTIRTRSTPEDALQALCECYYHDDDTLLDIGRSRKWEQAHGPDGVAGLNEGEAGVVVCRDGALYLLYRAVVPPGVHDVQVAQLDLTFTFADTPDAAAATRPVETSREEENEAR